MSEVEKELEMSGEAFSDLDSMDDVSLRRRYSTLYYGVYHAARAVMISLEYAPKTHSGLDSLVHNILVKDRGELSEEEASVFSKLKTRREQADYETGFLGSEEEFEQLKVDARKLADKLEELV